MDREAARASCAGLGPAGGDLRQVGPRGSTSSGQSCAWASWRFSIPSPSVRVPVSVLPVARSRPRSLRCRRRRRHSRGPGPGPRGQQRGLLRSGGSRCGSISLSASFGCRERPARPLPRAAAPRGSVTGRPGRPRPGRFVLELGDLDLERDRLDDVARRGRDAGGADDRSDRGEDAADLLGVDSGRPAAPRFSAYETGGASTAASAAMRTSMSVSGSRPEASIESAVMLASRSRTGVSVVESAMVPSFRCSCQGRGVGRGVVLGHGLDLARAARSCRRTAGAGCRAGGSSTSPCRGRSGASWSPCRSGAVGPK